MQRAVEILSRKLGAEGFDERFPVLESIRPWLEERGYFLYHHFYDIDGDEFPVFSYPHFQDEHPDGAPQLPHSFYGGGYKYNDSQHIVQSPSMHRHVALKMTKHGSAEYETYRRLSQEKSLYTSDPAEFGCVMPPLDFIDLGCGWWFVVMPRWGRTVFRPWFGSIREVLHFMQSCLKPNSVPNLSSGSLHPSQAFHYISQGDDFTDDYFRPSLRKAGRLSYALIDFDWSYVLPLDSKASETRLPAHESYIWFCSVANDTAQGELDYEPFAFDVGSLGMFFCEEFQHLSKMVPMFAPFLDRMITRNVPTRFAAPEALSFFNDHVLPSVPPSTLDDHPPPKDEYEFRTPEIYDRWVGLDPDFVKTWEAYRLPPLKWWTKVLRWICGYPFGLIMVQSIRKVGLVLGSAFVIANRSGSQCSPTSEVISRRYNDMTAAYLMRHCAGVHDYDGGANRQGYRVAGRLVLKWTNEEKFSASLRDIHPYRVEGSTGKSSSSGGKWLSCTWQIGNFLQPYLEEAGPEIFEYLTVMGANRTSSILTSVPAVKPGAPCTSFVSPTQWARQKYSKSTKHMDCGVHVRITSENDKWGLSGDAVQASLQIVSPQSNLRRAVWKKSSKPNHLKKKLSRTIRTGKEVPKS
ncbi:hypothetical protein F5I97DRAFT_1828376 [Phlebopus sp. FC_14]|nr:hypothetical protein F5I97DRAFT_1828376 [Phlebopus sp. FC_14]